MLATADVWQENTDFLIEDRGTLKRAGRRIVREIEELGTYYYYYIEER